MNHINPLNEAAAVRCLRDSLAAVDDDNELFLNTIEGETNLLEAIDQLLARMAFSRAMVAGLELVTSDLDSRRRRYEARLETDRAVIEQAMMIAELERMERPAATLSLAKRQPRVEIQTEADIPAEFWRVGDPILDRKALSAALKSGRAVPGACLSNAAPSLTVRIK